jgi:hypothetical protein
LYRFTIVTGIVPDLQYAAGGYRPVGSGNVNYGEVTSEWYPVLKGSPALELEAKPFAQPGTEPFSAMLSIGIEFGTIVEDNIIKKIKYAGSGKILGVR